jgi:hypothetical protein
MAIPYNGNIPQPTDIPAQSQSQILTNFGSIQAIIDVNHADFGAATAGQHNYVQMPVQASAPAVNVGDVGLYNLLSGGSNQMFLRKSDGTSIPLTQATLNTPGYGYLPSGALMQWGSATANTSPYGPINFPVAYGTMCFFVMISMNSPSNADPNTFVSVILPVTTTGFTVNLYKRDAHGQVPVTNTGQFYWLALGI